MSKNGIRYSDEFKQQIVDLYNSGQSVLELSREYGVATVTIYKWIRQHSPVKIADNKEISNLTGISKRTLLRAKNTLQIE